MCEPDAVKTATSFGLSLIALLVFVPRQPLAETPKKPSKATERVIWKYETLVMQGALLTPQGWKNASELFQQAIVYPKDSPITVVWTGRIVGEDWVKDDRAQVESKYVEIYGSIDAKLRYDPQNSYCDAMTIYDLVLTDTASEDEGGQSNSPTQMQRAREWKMAGPTRRAAPVEKVISYLIRQRDRTDDLVIKENAIRSIRSLRDTLKKLKSGRGASAC